MPFLSGLILINIAVAGVSDLPKQKDWKTFKNSNGYELSIPSCWQPEIGGNYEEAPLEKNVEVFFAEGDSCKTAVKSPSVSNGVMISVHVYKGAKKVELIRTFAEREKMEKNRLANKINLYFKRMQLGNADAVVYVETLGGSNDKIRWQANILCGNKMLNLSGPSIINPDPSVKKRLQEGDLALPEPEKTIWESIRCVDST